MKSLLAKLSLGFGGLLAILLAASLLSIVVLTRYSRVLEQVFRENYDSAVYCNQLKESLDALNARAQQMVWDEPGEARAIDEEAQFRRFETNLNRQFANVSLPGELELTRELAALWADYRKSYQAFDAAGQGRRDIYRSQLLGRYQELKQLAQQIADMNMSNMVSVDGRGKQTLIDVRRAMLVLVAVAVALSAGLVGTVIALVLRPLRTLTRSARQIGTGNLDLHMPVRSRDEIGQLTEAFNTMASRLREFKRRDTDRLARTQQTTQLAIDSLPDAVIVIGLDGKVEISNRAAQAHFNIQPGACVAELKLKWLEEIVRVVLRDGRPFEREGYEGVIQLFDGGRERFLLPRGVPMLDDRGESIGAAIVLVDVTLLRHADELKSGLVSTVSHELRTPLTSLRMAVALLKGERVGELTPRQRTLVATADETTERLYQIIENLLNMSRLDSGRGKFQMRPVAVAEVLDAALAPIADELARKGFHLQEQIEPGTPAVVADATFIGHVLANLLSNAMKFTPGGGSIGVRIGGSGSRVAFCVWDTGPGIPQQYVGQLFVRFFRVPVADGPSGMGLGLSIAREIVEAHGGHIDYHPRPGGGSEFRFTLPAADPRRQVNISSTGASPPVEG